MPAVVGRVGIEPTTLAEALPKKRGKLPKFGTHTQMLALAPPGPGEAALEYPCSQQKGLYCRVAAPVPGKKARRTFVDRFKTTSTGAEGETVTENHRGTVGLAVALDKGDQVVEYEAAKKRVQALREEVHGTSATEDEGITRMTLGDAWAGRPTNCRRGRRRVPACSPTRPWVNSPRPCSRPISSLRGLSKPCWMTRSSRPTGSR